MTTQIPVFNEKFVVERCLRAVCAMDYPAGLHQIQVLDDSTDETTAIVERLVAELRTAGHDVQIARRSERRGFKAGALNEGMRSSTGEFLSIFDADFVPPSDFLRATVPVLTEHPRCAFVQARWGHLNADYSLLTATQAVGIDGHFGVEQSARAWNGLFLNFNGTAGVWRREAIEAAGGWSSDTLTEDLALSYRVQLAGWEGRYLFDAVAPAEIPADMNSLKSQQYRWAKGSIQTAKKVLPGLLRRRDVGAAKKVHAVLHLTHYLVHPLIVLMTVLSLPLLVWGRHLLVPGLMIPLAGVMLISLFAPSSLYAFSQRLIYFDWRRRLRVLPAMVAFGIGLAVNNTKGVLSALIQGDPGEFVRTPKLGSAVGRRGAVDGEAGHSPGASYLPERASTCLIEIALGAWAAAAFAVYVGQYKFAVGAVLLLHAVGFLGVGIVSLIHGWGGVAASLPGSRFDGPSPASASIHPVSLAAASQALGPRAGDRISESGHAPVRGAA